MPYTDKSMWMGLWEKVISVVGVRDCFCGVPFASSLSQLTMRPSLLLLQCSAYLDRLIWMIFEMEGKWPYSCFVLCFFHDLFKISRRIFVQFPFSVFSKPFLSDNVIQKLLGRNLVLFPRIDQSPIWSIPSRKQPTPSQGAYWH